MPLSLTDKQLATVTDAASLIAPAARDGFLRSVAAVLGSDDHPSDGAVMRALSLVLSERGVAVGKQFFRGGHHGDTSRSAHRSTAAVDGRGRPRLVVAYRREAAARDRAGSSLVIAQLLDVIASLARLANATVSFIAEACHCLRRPPRGVALRARDGHMGSPDPECDPAGLNPP
jgi:hypothetical protein